MKLVVISHKETWKDTASPTGYSTVGGFPLQIKALSELFDETIVVSALRRSAPPSGRIPLTGHGLLVRPLPEPTGMDLRRKIALLTWLPCFLPALWRAVGEADAVHAPVPGDLGTIGILVALARRKPLFVRHCGTWGQVETLADRFLLWLLERVAGGKNVVLATGGGDSAPSSANPSIQWIFSTSLSEREWEDLPRAASWSPGEPLRLVSVGRLTKSKNVTSTIEALSLLLADGLDVRVDIAGDGGFQPTLEQLVAELDVGSRVHFHGNISHQQVLQLLARSHLFVFPTQREGFPKAVLEAMACGLPVIVPPISVLPTLVGERNGILLKDTSAKAVAAAVRELIADPARLAKKGDSARNDARAYTLDRWRDSIGATLQHAWNRKLHTPDA